jgi:hypothetical protein
MPTDRREQLELFVQHETTHECMPREQLLSQLAALVEAYKSGALGGTQHELYPDVEPDSRERVLYFTLAPALNYQRKSEGLWQAAFNTYADGETRFVFEPSEVVRGIADYRQALTRYGLALQPEKQTNIWFTIATSLNSSFGGDPCNLFAECAYSVPRIKELVEGRKRNFPYLSGPKLLNYWLYMISCFTTVPLEGREAISIVPDSHVTRATVKLGLATPDQLRGPRDVEAVWNRTLRGTGFAACDLHAPLWRWSRAGFPVVRGFDAALQGREWLEVP